MRGAGGSFDYKKRLMAVVMMRLADSAQWGRDLALLFGISLLLNNSKDLLHVLVSPRVCLVLAGFLVFMGGVSSCTWTASTLLLRSSLRWEGAAGGCGGRDADFSGAVGGGKCSGFNTGQRH